MDHLTPSMRSKNMASIGSKDTKPEIIVRKLIFSLGFRYRLNQKALPGKPDIVLKKYKTVIFINGCFWHHHLECNRANWPKSNTIYWLNKINANIERDKVNKSKLESLGWKVITIWECETKDSLKLNHILTTNLR